MAITDWRWATSSAGISGFTESGFVSGASTGNYKGSVGEFLRVSVKYRDGASVEDDPMTGSDERNDDPETPSEVAIESGYDSDEVLSTASRYAVQFLDPADRPSTADRLDSAR